MSVHKVSAKDVHLFDGLPAAPRQKVNDSRRRGVTRGGRGEIIKVLQYSRMASRFAGR